MQHLPRSSTSTTRKPVPTSNNTPVAPLSTQLPSPPPIPQSEPTTAAAAASSSSSNSISGGGGGLKKSKSVRAKRALKSIANPIKTRREEKARRNEVETAERRENEKNVQDFLVSGRDYCERNFS